MKSLLHYPGGKKRIASWIINYMPPHHSYLEPFFGCGGVFFSKPPARIETINDLDGDVVNFFRVIRDPVTRGRKQYRYEMEDREHVEMLEEICRSDAMVMLSGYDCELYQDYLGGWHKFQISARAQHNLRRIETLWMNFNSPDMM